MHFLNLRAMTHSIPRFQWIIIVPCDHRWPIRKDVSNAKRSIAVALPMLRRVAREHQRPSAMDRPWITKPSAIVSHQICIADVYTSIADVSPVYRRCVADVSGTFQPWCTSPNVRRLLGAARQNIADSIWRRNIGREFQYMHWNCSRCPDALAKHGAYSCTSPIICRTTGAWWRCSGDAQICASREHREA